ncbi:CRTAC1 family protein [Wenyingzhuangia fucanilytica]|nr:CRTAC1 family protein [Wenyingzhuangia fucanilytica]
MYTKNNYIFFAKTIFCSFLTFLLSQDGLFAQTTEQNVSFTEVFKEFPRQEKNLRKWDAPVVADLDKDGYPDLLINDHGYGIQVCWNNKGKFAKPYDIIMGDLHGVSVGDINNDGQLEVIMSRGGGSGSNARNSKIYTVKGRKFIPLADFNPPLEMMRGRTVKFIDGDNDGDLDLLNFAFPDAEKKGKSENYIYKNNGEGILHLSSTLPAIKVDGQKTLVTDFNNDNILDIILYGHGNVIAYQGNGDLTYKDVTEKIFPFDISDVTGIAELDYDNDGDFDLYFTRGEDFKKGETFYDNKSQTMGFYTKRGEFQFDDLEVGDVLNLENFQSQWPNNDTYYIGEASYDYEFKGETHSGKDIQLVNSDALGFPDNANYKDKKGWYIGYVGNDSWRIAGYLFAPSTGIVHDVKKYKTSKHPEGLNDFLLENKNGRFKDATKQADIFFKEHSVAVKTADFDNNGFQDVLVIKRGNLIHQNEAIIYLNNGDAKFKKLEKHNVISTELGAIGMAVETIDYNLDGKVDIVIGNERGKWHLFKNEISASQKNNFITVKVGKSKSGKATTLGALVEVTSGKNKQIQRIGSTGAAYSLSHNNFAHFGLGNNTVAKVKVTWSNGETQSQTISALNSIIEIKN